MSTDLDFLEEKCDLDVDLLDYFPTIEILEEKCKLIDTENDIINKKTTSRKVAQPYQKTIKLLKQKCDLINNLYYDHIDYFPTTWELASHANDIIHDKFKSGKKWSFEFNYKTRLDETIEYSLVVDDHYMENFQSMLLHIVSTTTKPLKIMKSLLMKLLLSFVFKIY